MLSHGHWDHVTGMEGLVGALGRTDLPVMIHPEFWNGAGALPGLEPAELPATSRPALEEMGSRSSRSASRRSCSTERC